MPPPPTRLTLLFFFFSEYSCIWWFGNNLNLILSPHFEYWNHCIWLEIIQHSWFAINIFKMTTWMFCLRRESDIPEKPNQVSTSGHEQRYPSYSCVGHSLVSKKSTFPLWLWNGGEHTNSSLRESWGIKDISAQWPELALTILLLPSWRIVKLRTLFYYTCWESSLLEHPDYFCMCLQPSSHREIDKETEPHRNCGQIQNSSKGCRP